ncbi:MAG TPA: hypothetical protein VK548_28695 [Candidatus Acidoferrum sp.]|nr:hypothetical protein [Candidatus Acidoferrum sp.]
MSEELEVLKIVAERLRGAGIAYMVTGSVAMNHYAVPRMTRDIDLVVELSAPDVDRVCRLFEDDFYVDHQAVHHAVEIPAAFNMIHTALVVKVDIVVRKETEYRRTEFARRRRLTVEGQELFVVAPEDLILSKLEWARESRSAVQLADVRNLAESVTDLDRQYLAQWMERLGLAALYREAMA